MASKFDLIGFIGNKACNGAVELTKLMVWQPKCTADESWNTGALIFVLVAVAVGFALHAVWRRQRRENYFW